jgi:hypothetical protein
MLFALAVAGAACAPATDAIFIHASDYDRSCTTAADCVGVTDGLVCIDEACDVNASVNTQDRDRFNADRAQQRQSCSSVAHVVCEACTSTAATLSCDSGTCHLVPGACAGS